MDDAEDVLTEFVTRTMSEPLPAAIREKAALSLLDTTSLALAAREHPVTEAVLSLVDVSADRDRGRAQLWCAEGSASVQDACFVNAVAAHAHFHDDTDMVAWAHPGSLITPVPVALTQARGLPAETALQGIAVGYATLTWLAAEEEVARAIVERGFRAGPTLGVVAAAAAAAATLRLPAHQTLSALGIAADSAGALLEPVRVGAQDWRLQNATAALRGAQAALLAQAGVLGPPHPLTGGRGFLAAFTGRPDVPRRWTSPPSLDDMHRVWFKALPTLGDNMAVAIAAQQLHHDVLANLDRPSVEAVTVGMNAHFASYPGTSFRGPFESIDQAVASTAFAVATLLVHGELRYRDYPALLQDQNVLNLVERVTIEPYDDLDYTSGWVRVRTGDDQTVSRSAADAPAELFFRDRATARAAALDATGPAAQDGITHWFDWLDGTDVDEPVNELLTALQAAAR